MSLCNASPGKITRIDDASVGAHPSKSIAARIASLDTNVPKYEEDSNGLNIALFPDISTEKRASESRETISFLKYGSVA